MNLPNKLTLLRIALVPVFIALFYIRMPCVELLGRRSCSWAASLTDLFDGVIAQQAEHRDELRQADRPDGGQAARCAVR